MTARALRREVVRISGLPTRVQRQITVAINKAGRRMVKELKTRHGGPKTTPTRLARRSGKTVQSFKKLPTKKTSRTVSLRVVAGGPSLGYPIQGHEKGFRINKGKPIRPVKAKVLRFVPGPTTSVIGAGVARISGGGGEPVFVTKVVRPGRVPPRLGFGATFDAETRKMSGAIAGIVSRASSGGR